MELQVGKMYETAGGSVLEIVDEVNVAVDLRYIAVPVFISKKDKAASLLKFNNAKRYCEDGSWCKFKHCLDLVKEHTGDSKDILIGDGWYIQFEVPTDKKYATITLRVGLDKVSNICATPGVKIVSINYNGDE